MRLLRGVIEGLVKKFDKTSTVEFKEAELPWAQTAAGVYLNGRQIGSCGKMSKDVCKQMGLKDIQPSAIEIEFDELVNISGKEFKIEHLPKFPSVVRDISIIVDEQVLWKDIEENVRSNAPETLEKVNFVDLYRGKQIPKGKKSVTLTMTFRDDDGTLTHEQVDTYEKPIIDALSKSFQAVLRSA
jgi:phenylalanyl-tRNA synthetase beta chain